MRGRGNHLVHYGLGEGLAHLVRVLGGVAGKEAAGQAVGRGSPCGHVFPTRCGGEVWGRVQEPSTMAAAGADGGVEQRPAREAWLQGAEEEANGVHSS